MPYSTDQDIAAIRPNILEFGVTDWTAMHVKAAEKINRTLIRRWYKTAAQEYSLDWRDNEFSSELIDANQVKDLSSYKALELIYLYLMKDSPEADGFEREMKIFRDLYNQELEEVLATGVNYDWDGSGAIVDTEKYHHVPRRLVRV